MTTKQVKRNYNPTGKGGFGDHPENRSDGGWDADMTFTYQYKKFVNMSIEDFKVWLSKNPQRTTVQELAWNAVYKARTEYKYLQEITNRTEGMPIQRTEIKEVPKLSLSYGTQTNDEPATESGTGDTNPPKPKV